MKKRIAVHVVGIIVLLGLPSSWAGITNSVDVERASLTVRDNENFTEDASGTLVRDSVNQEADLTDNGVTIENQVMGFSLPAWKAGSNYRQGSYGLGFEMKTNPGNTVTNPSFKEHPRNRERSQYWFVGHLDSDPSSNKTIQSSKVEWNQEYYTCFSFKVPSNYHAAGQTNYIWGLWQTTGGVARIALPPNNPNNNDPIRLQGIAGYTNDSGQAVNPVIGEALIPKNTWIDVVTRYKTARDNSGYYEFWTKQGSVLQWSGSHYRGGYTGRLDSSPRNSSGQVTSFNVGTWSKFGPYRPGPGTVANGKLNRVFMDEIRFGTSDSDTWWNFNPAIVEPGQSYQLKSTFSAKCVSIAGGNTGNSVDAQQYTCNNWNSQNWKFIHTGSGYYQIRPNHSGNKCLSVSGSSNANNVKIQQYQCNSSWNNQKWKLIDKRSGNYWIQAKSSSKCIAVPGGNTSNSTGLIQYTCGNGNNFKWRFN